MKYPLLEAMRAQRQREEDEIAAPHRADAARSRRAAYEEREARLGLERIMGSKVAPFLVRELGATMGRELERRIVDAAIEATAGKKTSPETTIVVPTSMLMYADPKTLVARVVDWWKRENAPRMEFRAFKGEMEIKSSVTTVEVRIPEMRYRHQVADL